MVQRSGGIRLARVLVAFALAVPAAGQPWRGPEELEVRVEDAEGRPLAGAEVVLEYASDELGGPAPLLTDSRGRMAVGGLLPGRWALEVRKPGFMSFRAEIALAGGEKPEILLASQHNVPGARSTMRVRLARSRGAPPAPARVERAAPAAAPPATAPSRAPAPSPPPAPVIEAPPRAPAPEPMPAVPNEPPVAATAAASPQPPALAAPAEAPSPVEPPSAPPRPSTPSRDAPPPVAGPPRPAAATPDVPAVESRPDAPAATPAATAPDASPAPTAPAPRATPPARVTIAAPIARACYECRPGESALLAESEIAAGGAACPNDLAARLATVPRAALAALAATLPGGCAVMVIDLPGDARYVGFRFEAAGSNGRSEDCLPGRDCPAGGCRFPGEPVIRREEGGTWLAAAFESSASRRGGFTVYWRRTR